MLLTRHSERSRGIPWHYCTVAQRDPSTSLRMTMRRNLSSSRPLGCAQALDPHAHQSLATIYSHPNAECDGPGRWRKFICRAVEIDGATTSIALAQPKN